MMEAVRTSETSVDNHFTRQYNPEDSSEQRASVFLVSISVGSFLFRGEMEIHNFPSQLITETLLRLYKQKISKYP
jgi:hypothetical protein